MTTTQNESASNGTLPKAPRLAKVIPLRHALETYVDGAPYQVDQVVRVDPIVRQIARDEDHPELARFAWQKGVVVRLTYTEDDLMIGASFPDWPMIWVRFFDGTVWNFWADELCEPAVTTRRRG